MSRAILVFADAKESVYWRLLKPGFRHVALAIQAGDYWVWVDGSPVRLSVPTGVTSDLAGYWRSRGCTVVECEARLRATPTPLMLSTCVGFVKALMGITNPLILTPHQLYRHVTRNKR